MCYLWVLPFLEMFIYNKDAIRIENRHSKTYNSYAKVGRRFLEFHDELTTDYRHLDAAVVEGRE